jgi:hypothetical protein
VICPGCGGIVGRDCWNPEECEWISRDMEMRAAAEHVLREREQREYWASQEREHYSRMEYEHLVQSDLGLVSQPGGKA